MKAPQTLWRIPRNLTLRRRLTIAIMLAAGIAALAVAAFAYARTDSITRFLTDQLQATIRQQAEAQLAAIVRQESDAANRFLGDVASAVRAAGAYAGNLLSAESTLAQNDYWDARRQLVRLPNGNWDNPNTDPGAVYARSSLTLTDAHFQTLNAGIYLDFLAPGILKSNPNIVAVYFVDPDGVTIYYPNIDLSSLVDDYDPSTSSYFTAVAPGADPDRQPAWSTPYQDNALTGLIVTYSDPVYDRSGRFRGVVAADVQLASITRQISQVKVGETGYAFLIDGSGRVIAMPDAGYADFGLAPESVPVGQSPEQTVLGSGPPGLQSVTARMVAGEQGLSTVALAGLERYVAYTRLSDAGYSLAVVVPVDELTAPLMSASNRIAAEARITLGLGLVLLGAVLAAAFVVSWNIGRVLTAPLASLTETARRITAGDLNVQALSDATGEMGVLARAFDTMTTHVRALVGSLEDRVEARTAQLRASADVGRAAASILDSDQLLREAVNLISDRFGFYYAAVFTLDGHGKHAVLREATGEAGQTLKARGHKLEVGGASMVGSAIVTRRPRIALDVGAEPMRFANPLLPATRSEIALPLIVGERVFGALDVQSTQEAAFDEASAAVLQAMADQIAVALNNANSYAEAQTAVQRASALYAASQNLGRLEGNLGASLGEMLESVGQSLGLSQWWVVRFDDSREILEPLASSLSTGVSRAVRVADQPDSPVVRSAVYGESFMVNDPVDDPHMRGIPPDRRAGIGKFMSVPIRSRDSLIGALSLGRSVTAPDLTKRDLEVGHSLASLIAIAIENRDLLAQTQRALEEIDVINRRLTGEAWAGFARRLGRVGVAWIGGDGAPSRQAQHPEVDDALAAGEIVTRPAGPGQLSVAVPITLRGASIGALRLSVPERSWTDEMAAALQSIAGHVAQAAENARLVEEAQARAQRERALTEATDKIRRKADVERILEVAAEELARHLNAARVAVRLGAESDPEPPPGNGRGSDHG